MTIKCVVSRLILYISVGLAGPQLVANAQAVSQQAMPPSSADSATNARLEGMSNLLAATQHQLEQTQQQLNQLRAELEQLRGRASLSESSSAMSGASTSSLAVQVAHQQDEQEVLQAEVKQHDQTKLESLSKYPVRVYGLLLFNAYSNAGVVDNADLPSVAMPRTAGQSHGSIGGSLRQTVLGISAVGPRVIGAQTSADLSIDFFGDPTYNYFGSTNGNVRLRRGDIRLDWGGDPATERSRDVVKVGIDGPLISPLSPTSFATVANPSLAWSGNLWTWAPEVQAKHTFALPTNDRTWNLQLEGGLWDPPSVGSDGLSSSRILSLGELAQRPGLMERASIHKGSNDDPLAVGLGGFTERQRVYDGQKIQLWAITSDWQIPLSRYFQLSGEIYRGSGLGGLGGGEYKDTLTGIDTVTGAKRTLGLNAVGGWAQMKFRPGRSTEANFMYGQDGAFAQDFHQLNLTSTAATYSLEQSARNQSVVANFIYRPKTYIIFSPEYRRLASWQIIGPVAIANIFTLSLGYQF